MKISAIHIKDFKRIKDVKLAPDADRAIVLIGGKNGQGKSSTLDALTAAFGGKKALPVDPVRHGADSAEIVVELDGGELTVTRIISADGESHLEVRDRMGARKAPQALLDGLISGRFLDPLAFLALPAKEQRAELMKLIEGADRIAGLNEKRERAFSKRTEVGRDLTRAKGELDRLPVVDPGTPIDVAELTAESKRLAELQRAGDGLGRVYEQCQDETSHAKAHLASINAERSKVEAEIERLKSRLVELGAQSAEWAEDIKECEAKEAETKAKLDAAAAKWTELQPRRDQLDADLARADKHNGEVYSRRAHMERRAEAAATVEKLDKEVGDLTKVIATIDQRKAEILGAAKLPIEGLSIDDEGITLNGVPFGQASGAERLRVALGLAIAAAPKLGDVWVRDGALLDEESLELVAQQATAAGKRCWIERVGTRDPGVIVIQDGTVAS